jgi:polysaccharide export outer membrane protein
MRLNNYFLIGALFLMLIFSSCDSYKKLPYLKEAKQNEQLATYIHEPKIMPNDMLSITVNSNIPGAALDFNLPVIPQGSASAQSSYITSNSSNYAGTLQNYIVDRFGQINFPILGTLELNGMTSSEAQEYITSLIYPRYISDRPIVNVRFLNFQIYVLGEVTRPGVYNSINGQMTILDALAAAGDMTIYGKRENVLLVRTDDKGNTTFHRINLQNKDIVFDHNTYYLQQNDKLYVETNNAKGNNSSFGTLQSIGLSAVSVLISIIAILNR